VAIAGSSTGTTAPLEKLASSVFKLNGPEFAKGASTTAGATVTRGAATAPKDKRWSARAAATAGSSTGTTAPLGKLVSSLFKLSWPEFTKGALTTAGAAATRGAATVTGSAIATAL
jgi:hypothetical protein